MARRRWYSYNAKKQNKFWLWQTDLNVNFDNIEDTKLIDVYNHKKHAEEALARSIKHKFLGTKKMALRHQFIKYKNKSGLLDF